jgi:tRNA(Arg) A34 adenosine deaminase TadA
MCLGAIYWARIGRVFYANTRKDAAEAGFNDELIYRELCLPLHERRFQLRQCLREEALPALLEWKSKADKTPY